MSAAKASDGLSLLFVHGFASSREVWMHQTTYFEARNWKIHAVDLLGHGDAVKPVDAGAYRLPNVYRHFVSTIACLDLRSRLTLVGHSLGASVIANSLPCLEGRVENLVFISPLFERDQYPPLLLSAVKRPERTIRLLRWVPLTLFRLFVRVDRRSSTGVAAKMLDQAALDYKRADPRIAYLLDDLPTNNSIEISLPSLFILGEKDAIIQPAEIERLAQRFPNARFAVIPDGGHTLHHTHHTLVNRLILEFLKGGPQV